MDGQPLLYSSTDLFPSAPCRNRIAMGRAARSAGVRLPAADGVVSGGPRDEPPLDARRGSKERAHKADGVF